MSILRNRLDSYPVLARSIRWGSVVAQFQDSLEWDASLVSNISIIPTSGERYAIIRLEDGSWELPGGTLEPGENWMDGLRRETMEELGAELIDYTVFGYFLCRSEAPEPYRPHIPHPEFIRLAGCGEVEIVSKPLNPEDGEQVAIVELVTIEDAVNKFQSVGRSDIAELYLFAHEARMQHNKGGIA